MANDINTPIQKIEKFRFWCQRILPAVYDDSLSYEEVLGKMAVKLNECIEQNNSISDALKEFLSWVTANFITRAILRDEYGFQSPGNYVGLIEGLPARTVQSNKEKIQYLLNEFAHGQTGLVIDGGFFTETGIDKNYNGGVW